MLASLELEILKGSAAQQRIDFAPLMLLFGTNSAGKSTISQAALFLHKLSSAASNGNRIEIDSNALYLGASCRPYALSP